MTEFYAPKSALVKLSGGRTFQIRRGIHHIPDELSNSMDAHKYGIKPVSEMFDEEWAALGLVKPEPKPVAFLDQPKEEPETQPKQEPLDAIEFAKRSSV